MGIDWAIKKSQEIFTDELKRLLETQHLYQSTTIDLYIELKGEEDKAWRWQAAKDKWDVRDNATRQTTTRAGNNLTLEPADVKLFCDHCQGVEAFNSISSQEATGRSEQEKATSSRKRQPKYSSLVFCVSPANLFPKYSC